MSVRSSSTSVWGIFVSDRINHDLSNYVVGMLYVTSDSVIRSLLIEGQFDKIQGLLESGTDSASFSFNRDIYRLVKAGTISKAEALRFSPNPQALEMNLKGIFFKT